MLVQGVVTSLEGLDEIVRWPKFPLGVLADVFPVLAEPGEVGPGVQLALDPTEVLGRIGRVDPCSALGRTRHDVRAQLIETGLLVGSLRLNDEADGSLVALACGLAAVVDDDVGLARLAPDVDRSPNADAVLRIPVLVEQLPGVNLPDALLWGVGARNRRIEPVRDPPLDGEDDPVPGPVIDREGLAAHRAVRGGEKGRWAGTRSFYTSEYLRQGDKFTGN
ncbi:MAG: hypothetical protein WD770_02355 [Actinomycetota bacterium]